MNQSRTLLVVGAHAADFVWRAAGVIAVRGIIGFPLGLARRSERQDLFRDRIGRSLRIGRRIGQRQPRRHVWSLVG